MDMHELRKEQATKGYGNLGSDIQGLQKVANDTAHRQAVLKEFASEMDSHDAKRLPSGSSPLNRLSVPPKEDIKEVAEKERVSQGNLYYGCSFRQHTY